MYGIFTYIGNKIGNYTIHGMDMDDLRIGISTMILECEGSNAMRCKLSMRA